MNQIRQLVLEAMQHSHITYDITEHPAVYTIEEMDRLRIDPQNEVAKNLFLCDDKKQRYFLIVLPKYKQVDLHAIRTVLSSRRLSFASADALTHYLGLSKGAVSPLGVLNDMERVVEVVFDQELRSYERIGVHPNENTATLWLRPADLASIIQNHGNPITYIML